LDKRDSQKIIQLAREGKQIAKIWREDFPQYDYWDIYVEAYAAGEKSAIGVKRMITTRLDKITSSTVEKQKELVDEIGELVGHLYSRYQEGQKSIDNIRKIIK